MESALAAGCCNPPPVVPEAWSVVLDGSVLDRVVLSVWAAGPHDIYVAGGGLGNGQGALALHYDGAAWHEIATGSANSFWWVWAGGPSDVFFVGEGGAIYRYDGTTGVSAPMPSPSTTTLYGVWGSAPDDVWAVGGDALGVGPVDVILHYDGAGWTLVPPPAGLPSAGALFKVWGSAADDVFACGQGGVILHYDGLGWSVQPSGTTLALFTIAGSGPNDVWAVGGPPAILLRSDGAAWAPVPLLGPATALNGVAATSSNDAVVVGLGGIKWRLDAGAWFDESALEPYADLHAAWLFDDGQALAVGGNFLTPPRPGTPRAGIVAYFGRTPPASRLVP